MNALDLLKQDHQRITDLFADARTYVDMKRLFASIKSELQAHAHVEQSIFYAEYEQQEILKDLIEDARAQHKLVTELLDELETQDGPEFENTFQTLMAEVQLHFSTEENEIFPHIRSLVNGPDLGALGQALESDKIEYQLAHGS